MTRQDATTCAAAVAPGVEARGLPKLSRSPSQVSPLQGGGEWSRWREAALRPVSDHPDRTNANCESCAGVEMRLIAAGLQLPVDLHANIVTALSLLLRLLLEA